MTERLFENVLCKNKPILRIRKREKKQQKIYT